MPNQKSSFFYQEKTLSLRTNFYENVANYLFSLNKPQT